MLHCFSKRFIETLPDKWVSEDVKAQALDFNFHWVSEAGSAKQSRLTSAISLVPTVSSESVAKFPCVLVAYTN